MAEVSHSGRLQEFIYNGSGQLTRTIAYANAVNTALMTNTVTLATPPPASAADRSEWMAYDAAGRLAKTVGSDGSVTENVYDGASRLVSTRRYANALSASATASLGNSPAASAIAPRPVPPPTASRHFYDADGLRTGSLDAEGYLVALNYDAAGRLASTTRFANATMPPSAPPARWPS